MHATRSRLADPVPLPGAVSPVARADDLPIDREAIAAILLSYYGGERTAAWIVTALGVAAVGSGAVLGDAKPGLLPGNRVAPG